MRNASRDMPFRAAPGSASPAMRLVAVMVLGVAFIATALVLANDGGPLPGDEALTRLVQDAGDPWFGPLARFFNGPVNNVGVPAVALASLAVLVLARRPAYGVIFLLWLPSSSLVSGLKQLVERPRPTGDFVIREIPDSFSFPSGHAMSAMIAFGLWFAVAPRVLPAWGVLPAQAAAVTAVFLACVARVWTAAHWPSDVLGSVVLGAIIMIAAVGMAELLERREPAR